VFGLNLAIVLLLIVLNGILAMSELAIVSARPNRLQQMADNGNKGAKAALDLASDPSKFLSTVQIGITLIGIVNGAFGGATLSQPVARQLARIPLIESYASTVAGAVVVLLITYLSLIIGELVPKQLALQRSEAAASLIAPMMQVLSKVTAPVVWFLAVSNEAVLKLLRADQSDEPAVTEEEVKVLLMQATEAGIFERAEQEMVAGVFGLGDRTAGELMTPRHAIVFLDLAEPDEENMRRMGETHFQVYPVCDGSTDNVVGVINTRDLWHQHVQNKPISIREMMRPALFVPEISPVLSVLQQMRDSKALVAIVIDEYGGVEGLLTIDDVLGGVVDEIGAHEGEDVVEGAIRRDDGTWLVDGVLGAHEVRELFGIKELPGEEAGRFETIGGFILDQLGHIPVEGESVEVENHRIEVVDMDGHRIDKVQIIPPAPAPAGAEATTDDE
jgi:putative hemolysin